MATTPVTFDLAPETLATLDEIAANMETDRATVLREAVALYLEDYQQELADIAEIDRQFEAGETIPHEEVVAKYEAWKASLSVGQPA